MTNFIRKIAKGHHLVIPVLSIHCCSFGGFGIIWYGWGLFSSIHTISAYSAVEARWGPGDAAVSSSKIFLGKIGYIWANLGEIWAKMIRFV